MYLKIKDSKYKVIRIRIALIIDYITKVAVWKFAYFRWPEWGCTDLYGRVLINHSTVFIVPLIQ